MSETALFPAAAVTLVVTIGLILALRPLALRSRLVDRPGGRKHHRGAVPIIGGICMFLGLLAGMAVVGDGGQATLATVYALFLLVFVGALDDAYGVPAGVRVLIQVAAVIIMVTGTGFMLFSLGNPFGFGEILLGPLALLGTLMVSITVVNSYNLVDGADGLAGTLAVTALAAVIAVGTYHGSPPVLAVLATAAILGFLVFNFPAKANRRVRTFMGDAGSTLVGFVVFWEVLRVSQGPGALITPVAGLWLASIPVYDSLTCFVRRIIKGQSPFKPGQDHFHHTLRRGGFSGRQKLAILGGLQALYAAIGVSASLMGVPDVLLFFAWSVLGLTQRFVISRMSIRHRSRLQALLRAGKLNPERAKRIEALQ